MSEENKTTLFKCIKCYNAGKSYHDEVNDNYHYFINFKNESERRSNGNCQFCSGDGVKGNEPCKRCEGTGICPVCHGLGMVSVSSNVVNLGANLDAIKEYESALKERFSQEAYLIEAKRRYEELQSKNKLSALDKELECLQLAIELEKLKSGKNGEELD